MFAIAPLEILFADLVRFNFLCFFVFDGMYFSSLVEFNFLLVLILSFDLLFLCLYCSLIDVLVIPL